MQLAPRTKTILSFALVLGLFVVTIVGRVYFESHTHDQSSEQKPVSYRTAAVMIGTTSLTARVADTAVLRTRGLSGTERLLPNEAMLFIFEESGLYSFWMKEMKYPIDMIWLDDTKHIVYIKKNATPESFPEEFAPPTPARYVLEVVAGFSDEHKLGVGDTVFIDIGSHQVE